MTNKQTQGLFYKHRCDLTHLVTCFLSPALWRHQGKIIKDNATSCHVAQNLNLLNLRGYSNCVIGSKVTAIWVDGFCLLFELYQEQSTINEATQSSFRTLNQNQVGCFGLPVFEV